MVSGIFAAGSIGLYLGWRPGSGRVSQVRVHVRVGGAGPDGRDDLAEFERWSARAPGGQGDPEARHAELLVGEPRGTDAKSEKSKITKTMDTAAHGWRHL